VELVKPFDSGVTRFMWIKFLLKVESGEIKSHRYKLLGVKIEDLRTSNSPK